MKHIKFNKNWNYKLDCEYFTTIRPRKPEYYNTSEQYGILLNGSLKGVAEIVSIEQFRFSDINNRIAYLDAGMNKDKLRDLMRSFYGNQSFWKEDSTRISLILLKWIEKEM